jgi:hypothetical protein
VGKQHGRVAECILRVLSEASKKKIVARIGKKDITSLVERLNQEEDS